MSVSFASTIIKYLIISKVSRSNEKTRALHDLGTTVRVAVAVAFVDSIIIFGITLFSSLIALGYSNLLINIKLSLFSAVTIAGLTFFNELKSKMKESRG